MFFFRPLRCHACGRSEVACARRMFFTLIGCDKHLDGGWLAGRQLNSDTMSARQVLKHMAAYSGYDEIVTESDGTVSAVLSDPKQIP